MMPTDKLAAVLWEADRHLDTLTEALAEWNISPAITWQALESDRVTIGDDLRTLQFGWPVGMPLVRKMQANLW